MKVNPGGSYGTSAQWIMLSGLATVVSAFVFPPLSPIFLLALLASLVMKGNPDGSVGTSAQWIMLSGLATVVSAFVFPPLSPIFLLVLLVSLLGFFLGRAEGRQ